MARIQENVAERVMHLARRPQQPRVIAVRQHRSCVFRHAVDRTGEARTDALHPASERRLVRGLDDEMRVVPLERVVHEPKPRPLAPDRERPPHLVHDRHGTQ